MASMHWELYIVFLILNALRVDYLLGLDTDISGNIRLAEEHLC